MFTKAKIFNLALGALLLTREISDADTESTTEAKVLRTHWDIALRKTLQDLDLDSTFSTVPLELFATNPNELWLYAYKYPSNCSFFRRIVSNAKKDNRTTQIPRQIGIHAGVKVIFTNQAEALADIITHDFNLQVLNPSAGLAIAYHLAYLSKALIVGKGANELRKTIWQDYITAKSEAQEHDSLENASFDEDAVVSEFVEARTT